MQFACEIIKRILALLAGAIFCACIAESAVLSPSLEGLVGAGSQYDTLISIVVFAEDSTGHSQARKAASAPAMTLKARHERVIKILKSNNSLALQSLKNRLCTIYPGAELKEFWIAPAVALELPASRLADVLDLPGVASVIDNAPIELIEPVEMELSPQQVSMVRTHLTALNVPALWSKGLTGRGRLVCNFDTGVEGTHPALSGKWRGNVAANSAAWFAPSSSNTMPFDVTGHGTHTMGLMVGSVELDTFGVAPGAEWIGAAVIDQGQTLSRTFSDILAAFEWAVDPDGDPATIDDVPDVILNSWGAPTSILEPCDGTFNQAIDNVEAAGIVTVFAAGNEGPNPQSLRLPANRATTPLNTLAVGAVDHTTNIIATFSSRGPSSCNTSEIKPEVVAPG
ncbi:MAG: S8 family serine peptidase, partial [Candidatus Zixiibacteriota bacterium]